MIVDIVPQQQLSDVFNSKRTTMTNGCRNANDLGKKADLILGHAPAVVDYRRQFSVDFANAHQARWNIPDIKTRVNDQQKIRQIATVEQLVPLIFKLIQPINYTKIPEKLSKTNQSDDENDEKVQHSDTDFENDDDDHDESTNPMDLNTFSLQSFLPTNDSSTIESSSSSLIHRKEDLIRLFSSSVNTPIDFKQPKLPITIPTYLFFEQNQSSIKRDINGSIKSETIIDSIEMQEKKFKSSHIDKQDTNTFENESNHSELCSTSNIASMLIQVKKEKPTANVKPLQQSSNMDNVSAANSNSNVVNTPDRLINNGSTSTRANYANLRNKSTRELNSLARDKKKQADGEKRTFDDVKMSMTLYLESVCYFIQCANDEPIVEQRYSLLKATLNMLQHLAMNYQKMFQLLDNQSIELVNNIRPKFLLINYWLQSYIYHLQFNTNFSSIERCATQIIEQFNQIKSPSSMSSNNLYDFSKFMLNAYQSNSYWHKAERLIREEPCKKFFEQLTRQISTQRLSRDDPTLDFLLYIFEAIELLRVITN